MNQGRIFCVGRNYREHIEELNNAVAERPVLFMKPYTALGANEEVISFPSHG